MWKLTQRKGQSMAEYAIVLTVVVTAIVAMQIYVKRGLQGKVKDVTDDVGLGLTTTTKTSQYEPYYATTDYEIGQDQSVKEAFKTGGTVERTSLSEKSTRKGGSTTGVDLGSDDAWK